MDDNNSISDEFDDGVETSGELGSVGSQDEPERAKITDISPNNDGKIIKEILRNGKGHSKPSNGDKVEVHYVGKLEDGTVFDSSRDRNEQFSFTVGAHQVIEGWEIAIRSMRRHELAKFTISSEYAYGETGSPPKIPPNATLIFEIELFDWKLEDLTKAKDGGVTKRIMKEGHGYQVPNEGSLCEIHLLGRYNGKSFEERDVTFNLGEGSEEQLVEGIEVAVRKMKKDELAEVHLRPKYSFGDDGKSEFGIPQGYDEVIYEIHLKNFEKMKESYEMSNNERLEQAELAKTKGTKYFKESKFNLAIKQYKRIAQYLGPPDDFSEEEKSNKDQLLLAGHLNLAICYIKTRNYSDAIKSCTEALSIDPRNEKGLFRRGTAYFENREFDLAKKDFESVIKLDPNNKAARNQIVACNNEIKAQLEREKKIYKNMFDIFAKRDAAAKKNEKEKWIGETATEYKKNENNELDGVDMLGDNITAGQTGQAN